MLNTVAQGRLQIARHVSGGVDPSSKACLDRLNECESILVTKGDWQGTEQVIRFFTDKDYVTLPDTVATVRAVNIDNYPRRIFNRAYMFMEGGPGELVDSAYGSRDLIELSTTACTSYTMPSTSMKLMAFSKYAESGGTIRITGKYESRQNVITADGLAGETVPINQWKDGVEGDINLAIASMTTASFSDIDSITKTATKGYVTLLAYDESTHQTYFLSQYRPDEVCPRYRRYRITNRYYLTGSSILCLCKMAHVPLYEDTDILVVQNLEALKLMAQAIEYGNIGETQRKKAYVIDALTELHAEIADQSEPNHIITVAEGQGFNSPNMV